MQMFKCLVLLATAAIAAATKIECVEPAPVVDVGRCSNSGGRITFPSLNNAYATSCSPSNSCSLVTLKTSALVGVVLGHTGILTLNAHLSVSVASILCALNAKGLLANITVLVGIRLQLVTDCLNDDLTPLLKALLGPNGLVDRTKLDGVLAGTLHLVGGVLQSVDCLVDNLLGGGCGHRLL